MELKELFEPLINFIKGFQKKDSENSKDAAKDRLKLVLMQDRASVSPDFFEMMKKEIIEVIKKYIEIDEEALEVQLTRCNEGGLDGPVLLANIPIKNVKPVAKKPEPVKEEEPEDNGQAMVEGQEQIEEEPQVEETKEEVVEVTKEDVFEETEETRKNTEELKEEPKEKEEVEVPKEEEKENTEEKKKTTTKRRSKNKN